jgi:ornithine cyclodeaminase/alanine dehydrogenase-like protein (mu-crystallin family)
MLVFEARTGLLVATLFDEGYLTELRTGAAGAVCAKYLAQKKINQVALIDAGSQARFQLEAIAHVRDVERVRVWSRSRERAQSYVAEMRAKMGIAFEVAASVEQAVHDSDLVVTVTPSREPLIKAEYLSAGQTIIAVGSDGPDKQELEAAALACADRIVADSLAQCVHLGEIHHAVNAGLIAPSSVVELGAVVTSRAPGRTHDDELIICDLTGIGVQDAAIAALVAGKAIGKGT